MKNQTEEKTAELLLYGDIGSYEGWNDVTAKEFAHDLAELGDVDVINLRINSVGGDVFAGQAIHSMLKRNKATINVYVDGLAASIASVVAMAGNNIYMPSNSMMMIHHPWSGCWGNATEFRKAADDLDKIAESIIVTYQEKTGLEREKIIEIMDNETWLTAAEAVELGFATAETEELQAVASLQGKILAMNGQNFDLSRFKHIPQNLQKEVKKKVENSVITAEVLEKEYPDLYNAVKKAGYNDGVKDERARMQALDEINVPGCEDIVKKARYETGKAANEIALEIVTALKKNTPNVGFLNNLFSDAGEISNLNAGSDTQKNSEAERKTVAQKMAAAGNKIRGGRR